MVFSLFNSAKGSSATIKMGSYDQVSVARAVFCLWNQVNIFWVVHLFSLNSKLSMT